MIGTAVGPYQITGLIGRGGMGEVYRGRHAQLGREAAIKLIATGGARAGGTSTARLQREAIAAARLDHPGVVRVFDCGETADGRTYLAMELVEGEGLDQVIARAPMPPRRAVEVVRDAARALHFAHERRIVHRDVKPSNILVTPEGRAKVTDFGVARLLDHEGPRLTATGAFVGTPQYMAPEQLQASQSVGPASDVYGLGATFYEALTGRPPIEIEGIAQLVHAVMNVAPEPPSRAVPLQRLAGAGIRSAAVDAVVARALAKRVEDRYGSAAAFADDLERLLGAGGTEAEGVAAAGAPIGTRADATAPGARRGPPTAPPTPPPVRPPARAPAVATGAALTPAMWAGIGAAGAIAVVAIMVLAVMLGLRDGETRAPRDVARGGGDDGRGAGSTGASSSPERATDADAGTGGPVTGPPEPIPEPEPAPVDVPDPTPDPDPDPTAGSTPTVEPAAGPTIPGGVDGADGSIGELVASALRDVREIRLEQAGEKLALARERAGDDRELLETIDYLTLITQTMTDATLDALWRNAKQAIDVTIPTALRAIEGLPEEHRAPLREVLATLERLAQCRMAGPILLYQLAQGSIERDHVEQIITTWREAATWADGVAATSRDEGGEVVTRIADRTRRAADDLERRRLIQLDFAADGFLAGAFGARVERWTHSERGLSWPTPAPPDDAEASIWIPVPAGAQRVVVELETRGDLPGEGPPVVTVCVAGGAAVALGDRILMKGPPEQVVPLAHARARGHDVPLPDLPMARIPDGLPEQCQLVLLMGHTPAASRVSLVSAPREEIVGLAGPCLLAESTAVRLSVAGPVAIRAVTIALPRLGGPPGDGRRPPMGTGGPGGRGPPPRGPRRPR